MTARPAVVGVTVLVCPWLAVATLGAGGVLEAIDVTGFVPSSIPGHVVARLVGARWDARSMPIAFRLNDSVDPVPDPLGGPGLPLPEAQRALEAAMAVWNRVPTSFVELTLTGATAATGLPGFDFVNELSFGTPASFGGIAASVVTTLATDIDLEQGMDIDLDGDADVSDRIDRAADVDGDGDIELPAGFYAAGTILDADLQFNAADTGGFRFTGLADGPDANPRSVDLAGVAVHELGHAVGLSHSLLTRSSPSDGRGAVMFPFIDSSDPVAERSLVTLHLDDVAWVSWLYPEGSAETGPGAVEPGDVAFAAAFGALAGEALDGRAGRPLVGGHVLAVGQGDVPAVGGFTGSVDLLVDPASGTLMAAHDGAGVRDGAFVLPVPAGRYTLTLGPVDGRPVAATAAGYRSEVGALLDQQWFEPVWLVSARDSDRRARVVPVEAGAMVADLNLVTRRTDRLGLGTGRDAVGFAEAAPGELYVLRIPASEVLEALAREGSTLYAATFDTFVTDASTAPVFGMAMITTGDVDAAGNLVAIDLARPLAGTAPFVGQDDDDALLVVERPADAAADLRARLADGGTDVCLVLAVSDRPPRGASGYAPLVGLTRAAGSASSYVSQDGGLTFTRLNGVGFRFALIVERGSAGPPG
jgi:hypothetical protein